MLNKYIVIQQRINHYSCYVKHLIVSSCEEFQTNQIHSRRLTSVLERLFERESHEFHSFFNYEKQSISTQFIHYLTQQGEIFHVGGSYYTLPPERSIQLPDCRYVAISSLSDCDNNRIGLGQPITHPLAVSLTHEEYIYRPIFETLLNTYVNKLTNHHDVNPDELIFFTEKGIFRSSNIKNMRENEFYIILFNRVIGSKIKPEKYFAQWKSEEWYVTQLTNKMYIRLRLALSYRKNVFSTYKTVKHSNGYIEIILPFLLPKEENTLLRLIATPNEYKWPKSYLTTEDQILNVSAILAHCKITEKGV